jgi:hypothetical protein
VSIYDDDWGKTGETSTPSTPNRYNSGEQYLPARPPGHRPVPTAYPISIEHNDWSRAGDGLQALPSVKETATPIERALGLGIRLIPFTAAWLVLALGLFYMLDGEIVVPFLLFAGLTAATYYFMSRQEYDYSAAGLERHKADLAHDLQAQKLEQDHELKRAALNSYIKHLEGDR